ncbi:MAG: hypothetical protein AAFY88_22175, partial [Acidobacteriota bacterium]
AARTAVSADGEPARVTRSLALGGRRRTYLEEGGGGAQEVRLWRVQPDNDGDGLANGDERLLGTDPNNPDTDGGGRTDGQEVLVDGTNPLDPADDL